MFDQQVSSPLPNGNSSGIVGQTIFHKSINLYKQRYTTMAVASN